MSEISNAGQSNFQGQYRTMRYALIVVVVLIIIYSFT
jgi:hypothetical protein